MVAVARISLFLNIAAEQATSRNATQEYAGATRSAANTATVAQTTTRDSAPLNLAPALSKLARQVAIAASSLTVAAVRTSTSAPTALTVAIPSLNNA